MALGAGRDRADAAVDPAAGIDIVAPVGTTVRRGDPVLTMACGDAGRLPAARALIDRAVTIGETASAPSVQVLSIEGRARLWTPQHGHQLRESSTGETRPLGVH